MTTVIYVFKLLNAFQNAIFGIFFNSMQLMLPFLLQQSIYNIADINLSEHRIEKNAFEKQECV